MTLKSCTRRAVRPNYQEPGPMQMSSLTSISKSNYGKPLWHLRLPHEDRKCACYTVSPRNSPIALIIFLRRGAGKTGVFHPPSPSPLSFPSYAFPSAPPAEVAFPRASFRDLSWETDTAVRNPRGRGVASCIVSCSLGVSLFWCQTHIWFCSCQAFENGPSITPQRQWWV